MDFKPLKKDRKPGADGLFGWESPRLREALRAAKEAGKQLVAKGMTPTNYRTTKDVDMIARDLGATCLRPKVDDLEQAAFERWLEQERPSGDVDQVQRAWNEVREEWLGEEEPTTERGCAPDLWYPPLGPGFTPWEEVPAGTGPRSGQGMFLLASERRNKEFEAYVISDVRQAQTLYPRDSVVAVCYGDAK